MSKSTKDGSQGATRIGGMELHTETSGAARAILGGRGVGDTGSKSSRNTADAPRASGKNTGSDYLAGNINTGNKR